MKRSRGGRSTSRAMVLSWGGISAIGVIVSTLMACGDPSVPSLRHFPDSPNIILVLIDALRQDHLGVYGYSKPTTPFIDRLGRQGVVFDKAFAQAPQTFRSTATLFTSRYFPYLIPKPDPKPYDKRFLANENASIATSLLGAGYQTMAVFTNPHHHRTSGFWHGFEHPYFLKAPTYARASRVVKQFLGWQEEQATRDRPFFAYLHFMDVHNPYRPPPKFEQMFVTGEGRDLYINGIPPKTSTPTEEDLAYMKSRYDGEIRFVDEMLYGLMTTLEARGLDETVLFIASDHGDEFMEHGGLGHGRTLELEMLHVPLIVHGIPGANGTRVESVVRNIDLAPTILDLAGVAVPDDFEGESLVPLIHASPQIDVEPRTSFASTRAFKLRSATTDRWHFIWNHHSGTKRLRDHTRDPRGTEDWSTGKPKVVASLAEALTRLEARREASLRVASALKEAYEKEKLQWATDPEVRRQLESLGYTN